MLTVLPCLNLPEQEVIEQTQTPTPAQKRAQVRTFLSVYPDPRETITIHPIFKTKARHGLEGENISDNEFRQFAEIRNTAYYAYKKDPSFSYVEDEALGILCRKLRGATKKQTETLIGEPVYKARHIPGWNDREKNSEIWLYQFGICESAAYVVFQNGRCLRVEIASRAEMDSFTDWRCKQIKSYAIGKRQHEIEEREGLPTYITVYEEEPNTKETLKRMKAWEEVKNSSYCPFCSLEYKLGPSGAVSIEIKDGICTGVKRVYIGI